MGNISELYKRKFVRKVGQHNIPRELPSYFGPMIGDKKTVTIAELGSGPVSTIGESWPGVEVKVFPSDVLAAEYTELWKQHNLEPRLPVEYQDFEKLTYEDKSFDIVHCVNALDHTKDPYKAIGEMIRVCARGGWVYLRHSPRQRSRFGGHHYWDITFEDGWCYFSDGKNRFMLDGCFTSRLITTAADGECIESLWQKTSR